MMFKIAFRNIFRQKRRTVLTVLTMLGGFTLSSVSIAWSDGSYNRLIDMFTRNQLGHIQVHAQGYLDRPSLYKTVDNYLEIGQRVENTPNVVAWTPRIFSAGLVSIGDKTTGVRIIGIDPERENAATRFDLKISDGLPLAVQASKQCLLGEGLARTMKARVGDEAVIVSQGADGSIANDLYEVVGLVSSGDQMTDQRSFYLHLKDTQELLVLEGRVHEIAVIGTELDDVNMLAANLTQSISEPGLAVETWQQFARGFYKAMQADREGNWIMLFIIALVVAVGVLNTVLMTVMERRREYGVLRAIGTAPGQVFQLVLTEVLILSVVSTALGTVVAFAINYGLSDTGVKMMESFTYGGVVFDTMYSEINAHSYYIPGLCVMLTALLVSVYPAAKAARIAPARAMRIH